MNSAATSREKILLTAASVAPMDQPILRDGGVVVTAGTIIAVDGAKTLRTALPDATVRELADVVVLPGLVNPHTHLELSHCSLGEPPTSFSDWIIQLSDRSGRNSGTPHQELFGNATRRGIGQCLSFGVTTVGDI